MSTIAEEVRHSLGGLQVGSAGPNLTKVTLLGIATKVAVDWIRKNNEKIVALETSGPYDHSELGDIPLGDLLRQAEPSWFITTKGMNYGR